jgi:hypothetical protein
VYRHVIVPEIRGGATVMDDVFNDDEDGSEGNEKRPSAVRHLAIEQRSEKIDGAMGIRIPDLLHAMQHGFV